MKRKSLLQILTLVIISFYSTVIFANNKIDSLELELNNAEDNDAYLSILDEITDEYFSLNFKLFLKTSLKAVEKSENVNSKKWKPIFYEKLGRGYANTSVLDSAKIFFDKAVIGYSEIDNQRGVANTYFKLGWLGRTNNDFDNAMEYDLKALKIMESLDDKIGICSAYSRLAGNLYLQEKPKETLKYALKSIEIGEANNLGGELFFSYIAAADAYMLAGYKSSQKEKEANETTASYTKSLEMYDKAYAYGKKVNLKEGPFVNLINQQGNAYKKLGKYDLALNKYRESLKIAQKLNYETFFPIAKSNIAEIQMLQGEYQKSLITFKEVIALHEKYGQIKDRIEPYGHISEVYEKLADFENALKYYKKERLLTDEALSLEKENAMNEIRTAYEIEKKEIISTQIKQINQQRWLQGFSLVFTGLLGILLFQSYRNAQSRKRVNKALAISNEQLDIKNKQNETLLKEIHHRVKNNLQTISSLLSLQSNSIEDQSALDAVNASRNRVTSMGLIHQKLYQGENLAAIEMRDYFETIGSTIISSFGIKAEGVELEVDMPEIELDVDTAIPIGLITNELITNSLKYAFQNKETGKISISMKKKSNGLIQLGISDNGINNSTSISEGGTGFGSMLVNLLTTQLGGKLEQTIKQGTNTIIQFPLKAKTA